MKRCLKCGFSMKENYCVRCGYYEGKSVSNIEKYQNNTNELEILLKDDYQKIIYNKNLGIIFLLGPLYFCYYQCFLLGTLLIPIEFILTCIFGMLSEGSLFVILFTLFISRMVYVIWGNTLIKKILTNKIKRIKEQTPNSYQEILFSMKPKSFLKVLEAIFIYLLIIIIWIIIYRTYRGNW